MADSARARRLAKRIVAIVATEIEHQVKDPRLAMVTITAATVTPDLRDAVVYYTVYGDDEEQTSTAIALASATGVLRSAVGKQTGIKFTPTLEFKPDRVPEVSQNIEDLLAAARASDAEVAKRAAEATYAGESDPYRAPRDADETDDDGADDSTDDDDAEDSVDDSAEDSAGNSADDDGADESDRTDPADTETPTSSDTGADDPVERAARR